jgi:hypothetical protein
MQRHRPGETVRTSGIYKVVEDDEDGAPFEVTCVEGEHFPWARSGKRAHFELIHAATHAHRHSELVSGDR